MLSNDVSRFEFGPVFIHFMWVGPTITLIIMGLLWKDSGYAGLIGIIPIFIVVLLQGMGYNRAFSYVIIIIPCHY